MTKLGVRAAISRSQVQHTTILCTKEFNSIWNTRTTSHQYTAITDERCKTQDCRWRASQCGCL